ncbi:MAG: thiamine pyrophosphate-binding protein, partial [Salaquimonas sp.]
MAKDANGENTADNLSESMPVPANGAESVLLGLKFHGVDYLFANAGTDFPPIIEALCKLPSERMPQPITIPHETASVGMAHGYFLVTGKPQAVMVHVNVGLANAIMGVINAASDNVPVLVMSGRTPITESGRLGSRMSPIQYGQEMYDQSSLVSDVVKYHYEMRYPEQGEPLVARALAISKSDPAGPTYLSLPREPLCEAIGDEQQIAFTVRPAASIAYPDPQVISAIAEQLGKSQKPLLLVQRGDVEGRLSSVLQSFCLKHLVAVCEPFPVRNVMPSDHPAFLGHDIASALAEADLVIALDCEIPWLEAAHPIPAETPIIHIGPDPHFTKMPFRNYRTDIALRSDPVAAVTALGEALVDPLPNSQARKTALAERKSARNERLKALIEAGNASPIGAEWLSHCIS